MFSNHRLQSRSFRRAACFGLLIAFLAIIAAGSSAVWEPELINLSWQQSPLSATFSCPADAADPEGAAAAGANVCVEWCRLYQGGGVEGTGPICCVTPGQVGSDNPQCQFFR